MRARLLGWPGQVGIFFERKRFFERTLFEQKFSYIYKAFFFVQIYFEIRVFRKNSYSKDCTKTALFKRTAFERKKWILKERYLNKWPRPNKTNIRWDIYSLTCVNGHLWTTATCLQWPAWAPILQNFILINCE